MMMHARVRKFTVLCLMVSVLLLLSIAGAQAQTQAAAGKAKADRLVMGLIEKYRDYVRPWINGSPDHMIQHDPVMTRKTRKLPRSRKTKPGKLSGGSDSSNRICSFRRALRRLSLPSRCGRQQKLVATIRVPVDRARNTRSATVWSPRRWRIPAKIP